MKSNIFEQLSFELNEELDLINKKKMMIGYLWAAKNLQYFSSEENQNIIAAISSIGTAKNYVEYEYYATNILNYIKELLIQEKTQQI